MSTLQNAQTPFDRFAVRWADVVIRYRFLAILVMFLIVGGAVSGLQHLGFSTNYRIFFSKANPQLEAFTELEQTYTSVDSIAFIIKAPEGEDIFHPKTFSAIQWLTDEAWKLPFTSRVDSLSNFQHTYAEGDDLTVIDLVDGKPENYTATDVDFIKKAALNEPLIKNRLISADGRTTGLLATVRFTREDPQEVVVAATAARKLLAEFREKYPAYETALSGTAMMNNQFMESSMRDMQVLQNIMYVVLFVSLIIFLRSISGTFVTFLVMMTSTMSAMGFAGWAGIPLTPPSATAPTIILTLAIADSVHILVSLFKNLRLGMQKREAIVDAIRINMQPVVLTSVTTIIGFLTLNLLDTPPFGHLGTITAVGVLAALLYSLVFIPAIMSFVPLKTHDKKGEGADSVSPMFSALANFVLGWRHTLLVGMTVLAVTLIAFVPKIELNDQFVQYFDDSVQFRKDTEFMLENLTGIYTAEFSLAAKEANGISEPEYLINMEKYANWLRSQPEVQHVYAMTDVFKRLNKNMHGDDPSFYRVPDNRDLAAQYLLLYEMSLPYGLDLNDRINVDKSATRLTATMYDVSTVEMRTFLDRSREWMKENLPAYMYAEPTSPIVMFTYISDRNIKGMLQGNTIALLLISILIGLALRSWKFGLFSMLPNLVPIGMGFGVWAIVNGQVNIAASAVAAVALGIVVDDTVHFLSKYMRARREKGFNSEEAIRYAFTTVGPALVVTTVTLVFGFGVLAFSTFALNSVMGLLTAIAIAIAIVVDFFMLPPALKLFDKSEQTETQKTKKEAA